MLSSTARATASRSYALIATRSLAAADKSASTGAAAAHRPPLDLHGMNARYANATYIAASKKGILDTVEGELVAISQTLEKNSSLRQFFENPTMSRVDKVARVTDLLGDKVSPVTKNLFVTLAGNAKLVETPKIVEAYTKLMKAKRGEVDALIISAEPLSKAQLETVASALKSQVGESEKITLTTKVDPSILGGLQVQIGDQFLDLSVANRIDALSRIPL
jgi:F-type H+-transporting ATPase subunit O